MFGPIQSARLMVVVSDFNGTNCRRFVRAGFQPPSPSPVTGFTDDRLTEFLLEFLEREMGNQRLIRQARCQGTSFRVLNSVLRVLRRTLSRGLKDHRTTRRESQREPKAVYTVVRPRSSRIPEGLSSLLFLPLALGSPF